MRVRARYTKQQKLRFVSAIDLGRIWERALRKAMLPIGYSEGFTPHPKVSFPDALPLGYASTGEYVELTFEVPVDLDVAVAAFNRAALDGLRILDATVVAEGAPRLAKWLRASLWELRYPRDEIAALRDGVDALAHAEQIPVDRERKDIITRLDLKPALHAIVVDGDTVRVVLHHTEPPFRPSEVHQALQAAVGATLREPALIARVAQGSPEPGGIREALSGQLLPVTAGAHATAAGQTNRGTP
ncbi:MAG TPA: TIGR03936 family radical SAM-associated protein [Euzebyales bacterium]|nr:TIGR03936 family radical SAM-associated protein [Euzebyales bacterium]